MSEIQDIVIVSQNPEMGRVAAALTADLIRARRVDSYELAIELLRQHPQCICAIDADVPRKLLLRLCEFASKHQSRPALVLVESFQGSSGNYPSGVVLCPRGRNGMESVLRIKAALVIAGHDVGIMAGDRAEHSYPALESPDTGRGEVLAVFSVKGGVGKTTVAVNLAVGLAQVCSRRPLLVDANLYFGDVPVLMNLTPKNSIADLCNQPNFDALTLKALVADQQFGVSILGSPPDMTAVDGLDTQLLTQAIAAYRSMFDFIVVDTRSSLDESTLQILDGADRILLVITPELSSLYQTSRFLAVAEALGYTEKLTLVLNRAGSGLSVSSVEHHLGTKVSATIVSAGSPVLASANRGVPLLIDDPDRKKKATRDLLHLVELVAGRVEAASQATAPAEETLSTRSRSFLGATTRMLLGGAS